MDIEFSVALVNTILNCIDLGCAESEGCLMWVLVCIKHMGCDQAK